MTHDVFISYASDDKSIADAVCSALEQRQIHCWIAPRDARPGLDYADSIIDALDETSVVVFIVSSRSIVSPHVKREVEHAASSGTHIIPFRVENVELSRGLRFFLGTVHWIDALTTPIDKHLDYLVEAVQYFLDRKRAVETSGQVLPAAPGEAIPGSVPPSVPPRDDAAGPTAVEPPPVGGVLAATAPPVPAPIPAEPASSLSGRAASTAPPVASPVRPTLPKSSQAPRVGTSEESGATRGAAFDARSGPRPQGSAAATSGAGSAVEGPSASRPQTENLLWLVVGFGTVGAVLGELLASHIILKAIFGTHVVAFVTLPNSMMIVPAAIIAIVTWAWLSAARQRTLSPAIMGGLGGMLGGMLLGWLERDVLELPSFIVIAQTLQWAAFGVAGGLAAVRGRSARPAVSMSIALACVCSVRTLYLWPVGEAQWEAALEFLVLDLLTAIGWGVGLIVCPVTTAALHPREAPSPH